MRSVTGQRFLMIYSGVLTVVFAVTVLSGFVSAPGKASFDEIDVHRINVREPDGTLRMVISDKSRFPGIIVKGKEHPHPSRRTAGMLFYNDEGTENGGLTFGGYRDKDGRIVDSGGHLSFDRYDQDQIVQLESNDDAGHQSGTLVIHDVPSRPILDDLAELQRIQAMPPAEREKLMRERRRDGYYGSERLIAGSDRNGSSVVMLLDGKGRPRLTMQVAADGAASLRFLDADGKVLKELAPASLH